MAKNEPQSYANHARLDTLYHFILSPIILINLVWAVVRLFQKPGIDAGFNLVMALAMVVLVLLLRSYPLKVQDRLIRLEETLRLQALLNESARGRLGELRPRHFVALRFASDEEIPELVERILEGELESQKDIKRAIRTWRPDHFRV